LEQIFPVEGGLGVFFFALNLEKGFKRLSRVIWPERRGLYIFGEYWPPIWGKNGNPKI